MRSSFAVGLFALLAACSKSQPSSTSSPAPAGAQAITVDQEGFKPSSVTLVKGSPGNLVFTRTSDETCATEVVFPELSVKKELPLNQPVTIPVPTDKERTLTFQCGMGMYKSSVVVAAK